MKSFKRQFIERWIERDPLLPEDWYDGIEKQLLEAIEKDDGWVSVDDERKPELKETEDSKTVTTFEILVTDGESVFQGAYSKDFEFDIGITHWRELPNTPKS